MQNEKSIVSKAADRNEIATVKKPELLCPAGSPAAFDAAIEGGADAIYMGGLNFNARINAKNFTEEDMKAAIEKAHCYGVKVYIAANTLIYDREMCDYMKAAQSVYNMGADAMIVADMGAASLIKKYIPEMEIHASTQLSGHNVDAAKRLCEAGFSRMVCAREMSKENIAYFTEHSPIEAEVFVHGALCVCHSGQCLFSSMVGKRSGNRGECAQPCRLPYKSKNPYPLSLKDLCLAEHVRELCEMGVASFKIEGRMKSPEYVRDVAKIWRRLIDENRNADKYEIKELERIFSRGGFTDGYFVNNIGHDMMGVRSADNKKDTRELVPFRNIERKISIEIYAQIKEGKNIKLCAKPFDVEVVGDLPEKAINAPTSAETVEKCLGKLGATPYEAVKISVDMDSNLMIPISKLNAIRRSLVEKIINLNSLQRERKEQDGFEWNIRAKSNEHLRTATFYSKDNITDKAKEYFDIIYMPLWQYDGSTKGVLVPAVLQDTEREEALRMLKKAAQMGAEHALVGNLGHIDTVKAAGLVPHGDFRFNVTNNESVNFLLKQGIEDVILSPELTLPRMRDIGGNTFSIVYGRIPLMITEKCLSREISDCKVCDKGKVSLTDRKNITFPVIREYGHRTQIFNSVPFFMGDKQNELKQNRISNQHFVFSNESKKEVDEVIEAYKKGLALNKPVRRMN